MHYTILTAKFKFIEWLLIWLDSTRVFSFDWDQANSIKSKTKHNVSIDEAEEVFRSRNYVPLGIQVSPKPNDTRYGIIGTSKTGRLLSIAFTFRQEKIRVISARPMSKKERKLYEEVCEK